jgi:hypothetical protein
MYGSSGFKLNLEHVVSSKQSGVVLAFVAFGLAGDCAGYTLYVYHTYDVGEVASDAGGNDDGHTPWPWASRGGGNCGRIRWGGPIGRT